MLAPPYSHYDIDLLDRPGWIPDWVDDDWDRTSEYHIIQPDDEGYVTLQTIGLRLRAEGRRLVFQVLATGEFLQTSSELIAAIEVSEQARVEAEQRAEVEAARLQAESELAQLRAELERLRRA